MKLLTYTAAIVATLSVTSVGADEVKSDHKSQKVSMIITDESNRDSFKGPADLFTGATQVDMLFTPRTPSNVSAALVTFEPKSRSNWHSHPLGQYLIVTDGQGWVQVEGEKKQLIKAGDVVWTEPGVKHWHGATPNSQMSHYAIQEALDGKNVEWMEQVTDKQYLD